MDNRRNMNLKTLIARVILIVFIAMELADTSIISVLAAGPKLPVTIRFYPDYYQHVNNNVIFRLTEREIGRSDEFKVYNIAGVPTSLETFYESAENTSYPDQAEITVKNLLPDIIYSFPKIEAIRNGIVTRESQPIYVLPNITFESRVLNEIPEMDPETLKKTVGDKPKILFTWNKLRVQKDPNQWGSEDDENSSVPLPDSEIQNYKIVINTGEKNKPIAFKVVPPDPSKGRSTYRVMDDREQNIDSPAWYREAKEGPNDTLSFVWFEDDGLPENQRYPADFRPIPGQRFDANITASVKNVAMSAGITIYKLKGIYSYTNIKYSIVRDGFDNINIIVDKIIDDNPRKVYKYTLDSAQYGPEEYYDDHIYDESTPGAVEAMLQDLALKEQAFENKIVNTMDISSNGVTREKLYFVIPKLKSSGNHTYRITATYDGSNTIKSKMMTYNDALGSDWPIVPQGLRVESSTPRIVNNRIVTGDVTISWNKPSNYDNSGNDANYQYHIQLNTQESEKIDPVSKDYLLDAEGYKIGYREAKLFEKAASYDDYLNGKGFYYDEEKDRIFARLLGDQLFKNADGTPIVEPNPKLNDSFAPDDMPFQPGRTYFLRMYATMPGKYSDDVSVPRSVTIPSDNPEKPEIPASFSIRKDTSGNDMVTEDEINLYWNKVNYSTLSGSVSDENISYDLYIYTKEIIRDQAGKISFDYADGFRRIDPRDIVWSKGSGANDKERYAQISSFASSPEIRARLGDRLRSNTTYYFMIRTRVIYQNIDSSSEYSSILPVTTRKPDVPPGDGELIPEVPADFRLDMAWSPNPTSDYAVLTWSQSADLIMEENIKYRIICTEKPVGKNDPLEDIQLDQQQKYLLNKNWLLENPANVFNNDNDYAKLNTEYKFRAEGLISNKVYYFSIRREKVVGGRNVSSSWRTITITTAKIEPTKDLTVTDHYTDSSKADYIYIDKKHSLRIRWTAHERYDITKSESFIFLVKPDHPILDHETGKISDDYIIHTSVSFIKTVRVYNADGTASENYIYYADIQGLDSNTKYYIKMQLRDLDTGVTSQEVGPAIGRTEFSQADQDADTSLTAAERRFTDNMTKLKNEWLRTFKSYSGLNGSDDEEDESSDDYDGSLTDSAINIKLSGEIAVSMLKSSSRNEFTIDISALKEKYRRVFIPYSLFYEAEKMNTSIVIRVQEGEFRTRPDSLDALLVKGLDHIYRMRLDKTNDDVKDIYIRFDFYRTADYGKIKDTDLVSPVVSFSAMAEGISILDTSFEERLDSYIDQYAEDFIYSNGKFIAAIKNYYEERYNILYDRYLYKYNEDKEKLNSLVTTELLKEVDQWFKSGIYGLDIDGIKERLDNKLDNMLLDGDSDSAYGEVVSAAREITGFAKPLIVQYNYSGSEGVQAMLYIDGWKKIKNQPSGFAGRMSFDLTAPGKIAITRIKIEFYDLDPGDRYYESAVNLAGQYDLASLLASDGYFWADRETRTLEALKIAYRIASDSDSELGAGVAQIAERLELTKMVDVRSSFRAVTRQEAAAIIMKVYERKSGLTINNIKTRTMVNVRDEKKVGTIYFKPVELSVDLKILPLDGSGNFRPTDNISRGELLEAFWKMLKLIK